MGGAASSLHRLRNLILIRAYNARPADITVSQQFGQIRRWNDLTGHGYLLRSDILRIIGPDCESLLDELLHRCGLVGCRGGEVKVGKQGTSAVIPFHVFIAFLETGSIADPRPTSGQQSTGDAEAACYSLVWTTLDFIIPPATEAIVPCLGREGTAWGGKSKAGCGVELWMKKETVRTEKVTTYVTVDAEGNHTELVEADVRLDEVAHCESEGGEAFAHRESTVRERTETFDGGIVLVDKEEEVYVHLKSKDDELEFVDKSSPNRARQ